MFTRTVQTETPEREDMDLEHELCPPHDFQAGWATPQDAANHDDTVPALWCGACGEVRAFRIPDAR